MKQLSQLTIGLFALVVTTSLAMAQDNRSRGNTGRNSSGYNAYNAVPNANRGVVPTGPYVAPRRPNAPAQRVLPFTWEEKRHFDMATGEEG
jgi:hypothetical protein